MKKRMTTQKRIVYESLDKLGHASVESLIEYIRMNFKQISLATIYRNIHSLITENKIKLVKLREQDVLETVKLDHIHFVCESCGNVIDLEVDKRKLISKASKDCMHQIHYCDMAFYGLCQNCTRKGKENEVRM